MGTSNSKLNANGGGEVLPARIRPLLHRRVEELRKRKSGTNLRGGAAVEEEEGTLSKKQLLKHDDENFQSFDENETENTRLAESVEKLSKVVPLPVPECATQEQRDELHSDRELGKKVEGELKTEKVKSAGPQTEQANAEHGGDDDDDDEEDEDEIESGRRIGPGSPSFKIYCVETENNKEQEESDESETENQSIAKLPKSPSLNSVESFDSASGNLGNSNEIVEIPSIPNRKGPKKKKFGAMKKNILNVKNLNMNRMNQMLACTGNDRRNLLSDD
ncbi:rRNA-processing protein EFG1-like [Abrus precatorius]|uniref:rRNA-processing protein EFG1-like n=1 Tax=Abrus precatorius TaxID=3816 RepID=A0A8B8LUJ5_ABRPR|nr:rRNA-processing protein EFG1-like [Abrus precatorius]